MGQRRVSMVFVLVLACMVLLPSSAFAQRQPAPPWREPLPPDREEATITVGDTSVTVDLALTPDQQQLGLGYRNGLEPGHGMLFVFENVSERTFWMKGMRFCLDIIWIADDTITGAAEGVCPDPEGTADEDRQRFHSDGPASHVLEMPAGWLESQGYGPGTTVDIPRELNVN